MNKKETALIIISLLIGGVVGGWVGYDLGSYKSLNWCVDQAFNMLENQGLQVTLDTGLVAAGLNRYKVVAEKYIKCLNKTEGYGWTCKQPQH